MVPTVSRRTAPTGLAAAVPALSLLAVAHAAALLALPAGVQAQAAADASFDIGRVVITAPRSGPVATRRLLTSVDVVHADALRDQAVASTWELFSLVPGTLLTPFQQGTTTGKVSLRGFNGEGEVNAVKLMVDGVPANSNDGNMPYLDAVFPLELQAIEVVRGTNDARFGLHNVAGNVNLVTRRGGQGTFGRAALGSFGSADLQLDHRLEGGGWQQQYFVGHKRSSGWRDHADSRKTTLSGQWFYNTPAWQAGVVLRHFRHDAEEPGYLGLADARDDPGQAYGFTATDGGERATTQVALHLDGRTAPGLDASLRVYLNRFIDARWVQFSRGVVQQERVTDETHWGLRGSLSWRPTVAALHSLAIEGGLDLESQDNASLRYNTAARVRQRTTRDQAWTLETLGAYLQAVVEPVPGLRLVPAWRMDTFDGDFRNRLAGTSAAINGYGTVHSPKISAVWTPRDGTSVYGNWGRTFQVGVGAASFKIPPRTADLAPSINDGWELGLKFQPLPALGGRVAAWQQKATDEVRRRLNDPSGDSDNIGATRRRGLDLQLALDTGPLQAWAALSRQSAVIVAPDPAAPATRGKQIDHVPRWVANAGVEWKPAPAWTLSAWAQGQGDYFLERTNTTGRFGGASQLNLGLRWDLTPAVQLQAQVRNVTDRATEYVWHDGSQSLHSPGAPRAWTLALNASL